MNTNLKKKKGKKKGTEFKVGWEDVWRNSMDNKKEKLTLLWSNTDFDYTQNLKKLS